MTPNRDFSDLFASFNAEGVRYLLVGGYALAFYAEPRFTRDLDVWVEASLEAAQRVHRSLLRFGAPSEKISESDFRGPGVVVQLGLPPNRIDILTSATGLEFEEAWRRRVATTFHDQPIWVVDRDDLIRNKRATGREQDLLDVKRLLSGGDRS